MVLELAAVEVPADPEVSATGLPIVVEFLFGGRPLRRDALERAIAIAG